MLELESDVIYFLTYFVLFQKCQHLSIDSNLFEMLSIIDTNNPGTARGKENPFRK